MLPDMLEIPEALAATLTFDPVLTARDRAIMFAVSWFAGRNPPPDGEAAVMVPERGLRLALGDMRRDDALKEAARYRRLEEARFRGDETMPDLHDGVLVPTVQPTMRRRTIAGKREWLVEEGIVTSFSTYVGDAVVGVPREVLARARSRYTLQLLLRVLAWSSGGYDPKWRRRDGADRHVLRIPIDTFRRDLGIVDRIAPSEMLRSEIQPAVDELRLLTDMTVDIALVKAPSLKKGGGRVIAVDVLVGRAERKYATDGIKVAASTKGAEIIAFGRQPLPRPAPSLAAFRPRLPSPAPADDDDEFALPPLEPGRPYGPDNPF